MSWLDRFIRRPAPDPGPHILGRPPGLIAIIVYKAVWGLFETVAGILILFSYKLMAEELLEDPSDRLVNWVLDHVTYRGSLKLGALFIILGLIKLSLAAGLFYHAKITRKLAIAFFTGVAIFGILRLLVKFSWIEFWVLGIDIFILYYFWLVLPRHFRDPGMN